MYLDDTTLVSSSLTDLRYAVDKMIGRLRALGLEINEKKSAFLTNDTTNVPYFESAFLKLAATQRTTLLGFDLSFLQDCHASDPVEKRVVMSVSSAVPSFRFIPKLERWWRLL